MPLDLLILLKSVTDLLIGSIAKVHRQLIEVEIDWIVLFPFKES